MKYRVTHTRNNYYPTFFRTKREAVEFAKRFDDAVIERKVGCEWYAY